MPRIGVGIGLGRTFYAGSFADAYNTRVLADGGTIESLSCVSAASALLQQASLLFIPSGYKAGVAYSALPNNGNGDLTWSRNSTAYRTQSNGNIGSVAANVPRLSYMYGSCPAALLEPQRTNLVFPSANGSTQTRTVTAVAHTLSFWGTGTVVLSGAAVATLTGTGANNRVTLTFTPTAGSLTLTVTGTVTNFQLEAGAYVTTYIETTTASATRLADTFTRNNIYTNGLISASGGTWFVELRNNVVYTRDNANRIGIGDTTALTTNSLFFIGDVTNRLFLFKSVSGTATRIFTTTTDSIKIAIKWNGSTADVFVNGVKQVSATTFTTTLMENLNGSIGLPTFIQAMALFNAPLSDTDCITLTT